jgi:hypothetical protein
MPSKRTDSSTTKKQAVRKPSIRRGRTTTATHQEIATRAYYLHLEGGHDPFENWIRAEGELVHA